ncbi:hypothetical protein KHA96_04210 [Bacillus sp. FJAT-49711]|uniref:hypothetical protein n=1 Tax=Bacillus sp. FJAT-49711 TaxID=2833585 RepID=UPI001BC95BED|nr:hypothetical protein [Bacillus sp. FJAT-49711]MBS4217515.1 hypothetical protein [Bacillus sp. FJAT-49711]
MDAVLSKIAKGVTICYSEVFPNLDNDYLHLNYLGKLFLFADSYCMNPDCTCQEVVLNFLQTYPRENEKNNNFIVRFKLNGRGYKIHDQGRFNRSEIKAIIMRITVDDSYVKLFNERYTEMKEKAIKIIS